LNKISFRIRILLLGGRGLGLCRAPHTCKKFGDDFSLRDLKGEVKA